MARVSKKVSAAQREAENAPHRIWKTAIYARLSDFDDVLRDTGNYTKHQYGEMNQEEQKRQFA